MCFEGADKVYHKFFQKEHVDLKVFSDEERIKGAIKTDFILSAEIVVIALTTMNLSSIINQIIELSIVALIVTIGIFGFVALIVRLDDIGLSLIKNNKFLEIGKSLVWMSPKIIKILGVVGTIVMFLVGGGIISHNFHLKFLLEENLQNMIIGLFSGFIVLGMIKLTKRIRSK